MGSDVFLDFLPYIETEAPIPFTLMQRALNEAMGKFDQAARAAANDIIPRAGDLLHKGHVIALIKAELSDRDAKTMMAEREQFIERSRHLVPTMLRMVRPNDEREISSAIGRIVDCCHDIPLIQASSHPKKILREIHEDIAEFQKFLNTLLPTIKRLERRFDIDFGKHQAAIKRVSDPSPILVDNIEQISHCLKNLDFVMRVAKIEDSANLFTITVSDNGARTHIVECVYSLFLQFGIPKFVTTPGSDFSLLCSLIFELASGKADESFAGAISKFARSELRKKLDTWEQETRWENSDDAIKRYDADNFGQIREQIQKLDEERIFWKNLQSSGDWDNFDLRQILLREIDILEQQAKLANSYGPNLIWANQYSERHHQEWWQSYIQAEGALLTAQIAIGKLRRSQNSS